MLRDGLPPLPERMRSLPLDKRGFPVPWFVAWIDGEPDFRCITPGRIADAHNGQKCWLCGQRLGAYKAFVIGPMCAVNRISSEPPSHLACAMFATKACPFLSKPKMRRNDKGLPEGADSAGIMIHRNPGVALVWVTRAYFVKPVSNGLLFHVGPPDSVHWFAEGREATRAEIIASIESGFPSLLKMARLDGPEAVAQLNRQLAEALTLIPIAGDGVRDGTGLDPSHGLTSPVPANSPEAA